MTDLQSKIASLPMWASEVSLGGLGEDVWHIDLDAALARLALAREWIEYADHYDDCAYRMERPCTCGIDRVLAALEVPK